MVKPREVPELISSLILSTDEYCVLQKPEMIINDFANSFQVKILPAIKTTGISELTNVEYSLIYFVEYNVLQKPEIIFSDLPKSFPV